MSLQNNLEVSDESPLKPPVRDDHVGCPVCSEYLAYKYE